MSLIKREDGLFPGWRRSFSDLFDTDGFVDAPPFRSRQSAAVNVKEKEDHFEIEVAAPGMAKEDFDISVDNGVLSISCEKKEEKQEEDDDYTFREFSYSSFRRSFSLPENVEQDQIKAKYANGILKLDLRKKPDSVMETPREIEIS